jgi:hypothetical protein
MPNDELESNFPRLRGTNYKITSPASHRYNCIAWAANDDSKFWWPRPLGPYYWPKGAPMEESLGAFMRAFQLVGYEPCDSESPEPGFEKVAIFVGADGTPKHAARQTRSGAWTSKLGSDVDIQHEKLDAVSGVMYGTVAQIMKRPLAREGRTKRPIAKTSRKLKK